MAKTKAQIIAEAQVVKNATEVGVSDANCRIAQMAALQAIKFPFVITDCSTL